MKLQKIMMIALLMGTASFSFAGSFGQPGAFLRFGSSARALAMGGAYSTMAYNADALLYNPAGLGALERWELTLTHAQLFMDSRYEYVSFAYPMSKIGNFGVAIADMGVSNFDGRDEFNRPTGTFGSHDLAAIVGYGNWLWGRRVRAGASVKYWMSSMGEESASGFGGADIGIVTKDLMRKFRISAAVQNLGAMKVAEDQMPMTLRAGISYKLMNPLNIAAEMEMIGSAIKPHIGAEYKIGRWLLARAGYNFSEFSFGIGLMLDRMITSLQNMGRPVFDYAGAVMNPAGNDFARFSLTFRGVDRYQLSDLLVQTDPCERLTEFEGLLDKDGLIGAKANIMFGDCYFDYECRQAPLKAEPNLPATYTYFDEAYRGKFGSNWTQAIMTIEGAGEVFSQRSHYMFIEATMSKGITEDTKKLINDLIFAGGDSTQYDVRLQWDHGYIFETLGYLDSAMAIYGSIAGMEKLEDPVRPLALYRLAYLLRESAPDSALRLLDGIVRNYAWGFYAEDGKRVSYPMFPKLKDNTIVDEALFLMGDIYIARGGEENLRRALVSFLDIAIFYPNTGNFILRATYQRLANTYESLGMIEEASHMRLRAESI